MRHLLFLFVLLAACGSSTSSGAIPSNDASTTAPPSDCPNVAASLCKKAAACTGRGAATIRLAQGSNGIKYDSEQYCTGIFTDQCGPSSPAGDVPRVADPAACGRDLASATCDGEALLVPIACGGRS